ncbi:MAG: electron transfer flavoprotein-ubiquinone oxidoreductase [Alphaproteobacteria bacterium]
MKVANMQREIMEFDVVIVGAGPAGLSAAIRLRQLAIETGQEISVCLVEKSAEIGGHILSGAVIETRALDELIPDWHQKNAPIHNRVHHERFLFLTSNHAFSWPHFLLPPAMKNRGNYIVSLANIVRWLGEQAEALGVEIYPGFAAATVSYTTDGRVEGVIIGDTGINKDGSRGSRYQPGMLLKGKYTLFAEGCRGHLGKELTQRFSLAHRADPQTYGIGIKELWEINPSKHRRGMVVHTVGWPLPHDTYGGSFLYHMDDHQVAVGFVIGLDYTNPYLAPFEEFQRFKTHPAIRPIFEGGRRIAYGARALNEGGWQSLPQLIFPGGALIGCDAGTLNVPKIKGTHTAMKSGILAAEAIVEALGAGIPPLLENYASRFRQSWVWSELYRARNVRPGFHWGLIPGILLAGIDQVLLQGYAPWTWHHRRPDNMSLHRAVMSKPIVYPKPDGTITFDRLSSVYISNTNHEENQPCHLKLKDPEVPIKINLALYDEPAQRYCPAGVYEIIHENAGPRLQINAQNCVHCKTCDIKDPTQNIEWIPPQGGEGPNYPNM